MGFAGDSIYLTLASGLEIYPGFIEMFYSRGIPRTKK